MTISGAPVTIVASGGMGVTQVTGAKGTPFTVVSAKGMPVTLVSSGGYPMHLLNPDGTDYSGGGLGTITVDGVSIRFPEAHEIVTNVASAAHISFLTCSTFAPTTGTLFNNDQAIVFSYNVRLEEMQGSSDTSLFGMMGNLGAGASARTWGVEIGAKSHLTLSHRMRIKVNSESGNSADWINFDIDISANPRGVAALYRSGTDFIFAAATDGVVFASTTPRAVGAFATSARITNGWLMGCNGTTVPHPSGALSGFCGSISFFGNYVGAFAQADLEAISAGIHPLTQLTAANWRQYRDLNDTTVTSLTKPASATGDATAAWTTGGAGTIEKGGNLVPVRSGSNYFAVNRVPNGRVWGLLPGATTAPITLSGMASGLTGKLEARVFDMATGQLTKDWTELTGSTIGAGVWSGSLSAPKNSGWGNIDVRSQSDPTLIYRLRNRMGVGYKAMVMGQSQLEIAYAATGLALVPDAGTSLCLVAYSGTYSNVTSRVSLPTRPVYDAAAVMANLFKTYTNAPISIIVAAVAGTSMGSLMDDSEATRKWSDIVAMCALVGYDLSAVSINWGTEDMGTGAIEEGYLDPLIRGDTPVGSSPAYTVDHYLLDGTFPLTMAICLSPLTRHTVAGSAGPFDFSGSSYTNSALTARQDYFDYVTDHPGIVAGIGPSIDDMAIVSGGGPHEPTNVLEGPARVAVRMGVNLARGMQLDTTTDPTITGAVLTDSTHITVTCSRPGGGSIQTAWAIKSVTVPGGATTVQGFEVSTNAGVTWTRSGFTAEITNAAAGIVTLTKTSTTWVAGVRVRYLNAGPLDYGTATEADKLYHGMLYESGALEGGIGLPVRGGYAATL